MTPPDTAAQAVDAPAAALLAFPDTTERRLRRALRALDAALAEQRQAVAGLRGQLGALSDAVIGLGNSAQTLHGSLAEAAAETEKARSAARELTATAAMMAARAQR